MNAKEQEELKQQVKVALEIMVMVSECIRESKNTSLGGIPSGHLYSLLMNAMSLEAYQMLIEKLVEAGLVENRNHLLVWIAHSEMSLPHLDKALEAEEKIVKGQQDHDPECNGHCKADKLNMRHMTNCRFFDPA